MALRKLQRFVAILGALILGFSFASNVSAQEDSEAEGFPLGATAAFCEPGHLGPFVGCTPWEGITVSFESADGSFSETCVTSGGERAAGCGMHVPFGSTIIASIDPAVVPDGYYLNSPAVQEWEIPDEPPTGLFGGPVFELLPIVENGDEESIDEPATNDAGSTDGNSAETLPKTGAGVATDAGYPMLQTMTPVLLAGVASLLMLGAFRLRRLSRQA